MIRRAVLPLALSLGVFLIYVANVQPKTDLDCTPARLLPFSILQGSFDLDQFSYLLNRGQPLFLQRGRGDHLVSSYPIATPVMVTPLYVPVVWWMESRGIGMDDPRFRLLSFVMERIGAAFIAALSVVFVYLAARRLAPTGMSAVVALVYGLGTNTWETSSQALWQHGPAEMCLAGLSLCLLAPDSRKSAVGAGGFAALGVMARPTMLIFAALATLFVIVKRRARIGSFLVLPIIGGAALLAYNIGVSGSTGGGYTKFVENYTWPGLEALAGLLISPSRGLLVYSPAVVLALLLPFAGVPTSARWLGYLYVGVAGYLLNFDCWRWWWAGNTYGPRYLIDVLPALALCAVPVLQRIQPSRAARAAIAAAALWGIAVQAIGVYGDHQEWNVSPVPVNDHPERLWDFEDSQIPRTLASGWHGTDWVFYLQNILGDPVPASLRPLDPMLLRGEMTILDHVDFPLRTELGRPIDLVVRLTNGGPAAWPGFSDYGTFQVVLSHWFEGPGIEPVKRPHGHGDVGSVTLLPANIGPLASLDFHVPVYLPDQAGAYEIIFAVAQIVDPPNGAVGPPILKLPVLVE